MEHRRTLTMSWDGLGEDDDDAFFESRDRLSSVNSLDLASSCSDDEDEFEDCRRSSASALSAASIRKLESLEIVRDTPPNMMGDYDFWMSDPGDIKERRKRLLQGMGLNSNKDLFKITSTKVVGAVSRKVDTRQVSQSNVESRPSGESKHEPVPVSEPEPEPTPQIVLVRSRSDGDILFFSVDTKRRKEEIIGPVSKQHLTRTSSGLMIPSSGVCHIANAVKLSPKKARNKNPVAKSGELSSGVASFFLIKNLDTGKEFIVKEYNEEGARNKFSDLQTGKQLTMEEFEKTAGYSPVVKELMRRESRNNNDSRKLNANSYFSKSIRYSKKTGSAFLKNIMGVANSMSGLIADKERESSSPTEQKAANTDQKKDQKANTNHKKEQKANTDQKKEQKTNTDQKKEQKANTDQKKEQKANTDQKKEQKANMDQKKEQKAEKNQTEWVKVRQQGKSYKEFTALHMSQEIQAHEGSIWTIRFSTDSRYLASAGEDEVIHVWEVQECDVLSARPHLDDTNSFCGTPVHPMASSPSTSPVHPMAGSTSPVHPMASTASDRHPLAEITPLPSDKKSKKKNSKQKKGNSIPYYVNVPETVFALSEKPVCTFIGHQDDVLDLSWSSQLLLSSSMDKTVRLWDIETRSCLKVFAHNDYVTCIQFNPVDDDYFISGSLDGKVRIWSIPDRHVVDWIDLHEMVTAARYTPDSQGAIIGSHKGTCRRYSLDDCKLEFKDQIEVQKQKKAQSKKITGFEFAPFNPAEVLITSADSRIRIIYGSDILQKFRGFRNTSSQISASFSPDGRYVISASEDSQVYIWKREEPKNAGSAKGKTITTIQTQAHEHFQCKDVSVAIPWPGSIKHEPPVVDLHSKKNSKRSLPLPYPTSASPTRDDNSSAVNSKRYLPPLPGKTTTSERNISSLDDQDQFAQSSRIDSDSRIDSGIGASGDSFNSETSSSMRYCTDSSSIASGSARSPSWSSSWSFLDGGGGSNSQGTMHATAWGLVIVTASSEGEIRVYQNFGLPIRTTLF